MGTKIRNIFGKDKFLILYTFIIKPLRLVWSASLYKTQPQSKRRASASKFDTIALCGTHCVIISIQANYECLKARYSCVALAGLFAETSTTYLQ